MSDSKLTMYVYDDATMELSVGKLVPHEYVRQVAVLLFDQGYIEDLAKSTASRVVFCPAESLLNKNMPPVRKLLKSVKRWQYTLGVPQEKTAKSDMNKTMPQWSENELAARLAGLLPFNKRARLQPTDEELFGQAAVTQTEADKASRDFNNKFTDFFSEVQKPINQLKKFASEEEEIAYWSSIGVSKGSDSAD